MFLRNVWILFLLIHLHRCSSFFTSVFHFVVILVFVNFLILLFRFILALNFFFFFFFDKIESMNGEMNQEKKTWNVLMLLRKMRDTFACSTIPQSRPLSAFTGVLWHWNRSMPYLFSWSMTFLQYINQYCSFLLIAKNNH